VGAPVRCPTAHCALKERPSLEAIYVFAKYCGIGRSEWLI